MQTTRALEEVQDVPSLVARYEIDPTHAFAQFKVRHLMVAHVRGELGPVAGAVLLDEVDILRSEVSATIDAAGINTRNPERDAHLRSADFLDVERYPTISFHSTRIELTGGSGLRVFGNLSIRGVTHEVALQVEITDEIVDPWGNAKRGVSAAARINRKDYGVSWNAIMDAGGVVVSDTVDITLELELVRVRV